MALGTCLLWSWITTGRRASDAGQAAAPQRGAGHRAASHWPLREHTLDGLRRRDPITGLADAAERLAIHRMIIETPSLPARLLQYFARSEGALRHALRDTGAADAVEATVLAAAAVAVLRALAERNARRLAAGETVDAVAPEADAEVRRAFALLVEGLSS